MFTNVHNSVNHKQHQGHSSTSTIGVNSDLVHTVTLDEEARDISSVFGQQPDSAGTHHCPCSVSWALRGTL
jgi:hypothetical protein